MITKFLNQTEVLESFITGPAGSGKTTHLKGVVEQLNHMNINYLVVAYTHTAKDILISKLPEKTPVKTLHSWLKKRPGINSKAMNIKHIMTSHQQGKPEHLQLLIVDEFSFVGDDDYMSIGELQDELMLETYHCERCGPTDIIEGTCTDCRGPITVVIIPPLKVLYVGDLNQLSPIKGVSAVQPYEPFWEKLTTIHRTSTTISEPLAKLVDMMEDRLPMKYLEPTEHFHRGVDIDRLYKEDNTENKVMLAFTNKAVESHNIAIQGYSVPQEGDLINIPTLKTRQILIKITKSYNDNITTSVGQIGPETKYNPLKTLNKIDYINFYHFESGMVVAGIFGSYQNKIVRDKLGLELVKANKTGGNSKLAYKTYKTINDFVSVMDFSHCMTIHKSQGAEYENVYIDSKDLAICKDIDERMKLLYVGMSRSKSLIFMNS